MFPARSEYRFAWREGNRFTLLVDGAQFFPAMLAAINETSRFVALEMYLIE
ncbi:MAG: phosphatidylserine/phosphatidylglycerophosphate/cardiolipin synthase family protein, partial [Gammaproteobacteria bacterium]|nr:phosphatidylserine/phosphatidylglycerophosphate/cardiolipin synthase family protein [Gammaproteobacteria bacterium]